MSNGSLTTPLTEPVNNFLNESYLEFDGSLFAEAAISGVTLPSGSGMSYSCWVKSTNYAHSAGMKILEFKSSSGYVSELTFNGATSNLAVYEAGGPVAVVLDPTALSTGVWHHVCFTSASNTSGGGTMTLYVDGASVDSASGTTLSIVDTIHVGGGAVNFLGDVDEVAVWDTVLTPLQVKSLYNGGKAVNVQSIAQSNLKIWWRMGDLPDDIAPFYPQDGIMQNAVDSSANSLAVPFGVSVEAGGPSSDTRFQVTNTSNSGCGLVKRFLNTKSVTFDGVDASYSTPVGSGPDFSGTGITLSCYAKFNTTPAGIIPIFGQGNVSTDSGVFTSIMIYAADTTLVVYASDSSSGEIYALGLVSGLSANVWYQITVTLEKGGFLRGYLWGQDYGASQAISSNFGGAWSANRCWSIGAWRYGAGTNPALTFFSNIQVDSCAVFNRAWSAAEVISNIAKIYDRPDWSSPASDLSIEYSQYIQSWWRMGDTAGDSNTTMNDYTAQAGNVMTGSGLVASDIQEQVPIIYTDTQLGGPYFAGPSIITPIQSPL